MDFVYIGILLCALAFALIAIYISYVLFRVSRTMKSLGNSLGDVEQKLNYLTPELRNTLHETEKLVDDFSDKMNATDGLFDAMENTGQSINACSRLLEKQSRKLPEYSSPQTIERLTEGAKWGQVAFKVFRRWKKQNTKNEIIVQKENLPVKK
ncbi:DUF948 domain-containing protein [Virgibacillus siamensis]|uniref:DUF948 domain-containing protein n=1 Tax=Virgibacillus siamensis TaxID=480071 RepID=UPI00098626DC|nr:DUF948 domain-containing protein [Virgibacillus siamensis]